MAARFRLVNYYNLPRSYVIRTMATTMSIQHMIAIDIHMKMLTEVITDQQNGINKMGCIYSIYIYIYIWIESLRDGMLFLLEVLNFLECHLAFAAAFPFKLSACLRESKPFLSVGLPLGSCLKCLSQIGLHSVCATHRSLDAATDCRIRYALRQARQCIYSRSSRS